MDAISLLLIWRNVIVNGRLSDAISLLLIWRNVVVCGYVLLQVICYKSLIL